MVDFSSRIESHPENRLARELRRLRGEGAPVIDLTGSNPTRAGFEYPADLLEPLGEPRALAYEPTPLGAADARAAVAADYARRGIEMSPDRIVLTASTSEAYSLLFKVLCDPGDEVLVPRPSYPLFEHLTRLDAVAAVPYDLEYHGRWAIDRGSFDRAWSARTRAVLLVSPNNPTGSFVSPDDLDHAAARCAAGGAALIADEVFADYELADGAATRAGRFLDRRDALVCSLGGLSKSVGLPQVKLGWMAIGGPDAAAGEALDRLELACDTYLSVSTPVQAAAADLLRRGTAVRDQIRARIRANHRRLLTGIPAGSGCEVLHAEGGWSAVLHVPSFSSEEDLVIDLLAREGVLAHPGYFFDFPRESYLVVSLLVHPAVFGKGISRILRHFDCRLAEAP